MSKHTEFSEQALKEMHANREIHEAMWHLSEAVWNVDQDAGTLTFTLLDGVTATCPLQIIGTYNTTDGTWLWGWDHPSVVPAVAEHAKKTLAYGKKNRLKRLTTRKLECDENEAWEFTALACKLNNAQGAYCGASGPPQVYMTYGEVALSGKPKSGATKKKPAAKKPKAEAASAKKAAPQSTSPQSTSTTSADMAEAGTTAAADRNSLANPSDAVRAFIAAMHAWEIKAFQDSEEADEKEEREPEKYAAAGSEAMDATVASYEALIARFCTTKVIPNMEAFGSTPEHDPAIETIDSEKIKGDQAIVRTKGRVKIRHLQEYEYRFKKFGEVWRLWSMRWRDRSGNWYERL